MMQLGWSECDIRVSNLDNDIVALIEFNRSRIKSVNDILNESRYLEKELKKEIGRGRSATKQRNGKKMETIIEVSQKLGLSTTQLKKIKSIANYEPTLISAIDNGDMSVHKAYDIVREKYINTTSLDDKEQFSKKLSKLLKDYQPSDLEIKEVLSRTYPYSVSNLKDGEEKRDELVNHLDSLKERLCSIESFER
jgi:chromosome segregation and condensation protein ScpB